MCIDYPNSLDIKRTEETYGQRQGPGGAICLHENCVSLACASFANRDFLPIFAFYRRHNRAKYGKLQLHVFPFRFGEVTQQEESALANSHQRVHAWGKGKLLKFWRNLKAGYDEFNANPNPLSFSIGEEGYVP